VLGFQARATDGGADCVPVPDKGMVNGEFCALLVTVRLPDALPAAPGLNVTETLADWFGVNVSFAPPLSLNPDPDAVMVEMLTLEFPVFVTLIVCVALLPTVTFPKLTLEELAES